MPQIRFSLTPEGNKSVLTKGVYETFRFFSVTDALRYDVTGTPDLTTKYFGGTRTVATVGKCTETDLIIKEGDLTTNDIRTSNSRLKWQITKDSTTVSNLVAEIDLGIWFNYINSVTGTENYNFSNEFTIPITDNMSVIKQDLEPSTYSYVDKETINNLNIIYGFEDGKSCDDYRQFNQYLMGIKDGSKVLIENTYNKFYPPFILYFNTDDGQNGLGDRLRLSMSPMSWVYAYIGVSDSSTSYSINKIKTLSEIETLSPDTINKNFKALSPAAILGRTNESDLYVLKDTSENYVGGTNGSSTMLTRFQNLDNQYLSTGLVNRAVSFIRSNFDEDSSGVFTRQLNFEITNRRINNLVYNKTVGGNLNLTFKYDPTETDDTFSNIVTITE